jgi:hypothetical protein
VRWSGYVLSYSGATGVEYTFSVDVDAATGDGARLYIDGVLVMDEWLGAVGTGLATFSGKYTFAEPDTLYAIALEFRENTGDASARLYWESSNHPSPGVREIIPQTNLYSGADTIGGAPYTVTVV